MLAPSQAIQSMGKPFCSNTQCLTFVPSIRELSRKYFGLFFKDVYCEGLCNFLCRNVADF